MLSDEQLKEHPQLASAIVDGFALIAASDGEAHDSERERLASWLADGGVGDANQQNMLAAYSERCRALLAGDSDAREQARESVRWAAANDAHRDLVLAVGHLAIVADQRIDGREEVTIRELAELLGLDPDDA